MRPFLWFFSSRRLVLAPLSAKRVRIIRRNIIFTRLCRKIKEGWILARKPYEPWLNQKTLTATLIHLLTCSIESSGRSPLQDDWHVSFQITDTKVNPNLDSGADCNVMSHSLFGRLLVANKQAYKCKVKLKVCDGRRITSKGKVILAFECKGKYNVKDLILVDQHLPSTFGWSPALNVTWLKRFAVLKRSCHAQNLNMKMSLKAPVRLDECTSKSRLISTSFNLFIPLEEFLCLAPASQRIPLGNGKVGTYRENWATHCLCTNPWYC